MTAPYASIEPPYGSLVFDHVGMSSNSMLGGISTNNALETLRQRVHFKYPRYTNIKPAYQAQFTDWRLFLQTYEGGIGYVLTNLFRHPQERDSIYLRRLIRATHHNHIQVLINTYGAALYRRLWSRVAPTGGTKEAVFTAYLNNIDLKGNSAHTFFQRLFERSLVTGTGAVLVTRADPTQDSISYDAQVTSGMRPYVQMISPLDIVDWELDHVGAFEWVAIREFHSPKRDFNSPQAPPVEKYRIWTKTGWALYAEDRVRSEERAGEAQFVKEAEGTHPCGEVPLVLTRPGGRPNEETDDIFGRSLIRDIAPLVRKLLNYASLIDEQVYQHVFNILVTPESMFDKLNAMDWSSAGVLPMDKEEQKPFYLAPSTDAVKYIREEIRETELAIRYFSGLGRVSEGSRAYISDAALQFHTQDKRALIEAFGTVMKEAEDRVHALALKWLGGNETQGIEPVHFTLDIESSELQKLLADGLRVQALGIDPRSEANYEIVSLALKRHLSGDVPPERLTVIMEDLRTRWEAFRDTPPQMFDTAGNPMDPSEVDGVPASDAFFNSFEGTRKVAQIPLEAV